MNCPEHKLVIEILHKKKIRKHFWVHYSFSFLMVKLKVLKLSRMDDFENSWNIMWIHFYASFLVLPMI